MNLELATTWAMRAAAIPVCLLALRRREHRPIAALVLFACIADVSQRALLRDVIAPAKAALSAQGGDPAMDLLPGLGGIATDVYRVVWIGWAPAVAAVAGAAFRPRERLRLDAPLREAIGYRDNPPPIAAAVAPRAGAWDDVFLAGLTWIGAASIFVLGREHLVGVAAKPVYLAVELLSLAIGLRAVIAWGRRRISLEGYHVAAGACLLFQAAALAAYHGVGPWDGSWDLARVALLALFITLFVVEGGALWISSTKSAS